MVVVPSRSYHLGGCVLVIFVTMFDEEIGVEVFESAKGAFEGGSVLGLRRRRRRFRRVFRIRRRFEFVGLQRLEQLGTALVMRSGDIDDG